MIFTVPSDGRYEVDMAVLTMKQGDEITVPDRLQIFRVVGEYARGLQVSGPSILDEEDNA